MSGKFPAPWSANGDEVYDANHEHIVLARYRSVAEEIVCAVNDAEKREGQIAMLIEVHGVAMAQQRKRELALRDLVRRMTEELRKLKCKNTRLLKEGMEEAFPWAGEEGARNP